MNSIQLIGRLTRDPELRDAGEETSLCRMRLAVGRPSRDGSPVYVDVVCFGGQATACADHLAKDRRIGVEGRLDYSEWEAEDGSKRSRHEVIARRVDFLGPPGSSDAALDPRPDEANADAQPRPGRPKDAIPF